MALNIDEQYDKIYRYCYYKLHNRELAEDITQETFLRYYVSDTYRDTGKTLQYLYTIARNLCIDEYRKKQPEPFIVVRTYKMSETTIWIASSSMPVLALIAVTENNKSNVYGMVELELASRFSLKSVVAARMAILGFFHLMLLALLAPVLAFYNSVAILRIGVYLLVPYLLTAIVGAELSRRIHGSESVYACIGAAGLVSMLGCLAHIKAPVVYTVEKFGAWAAFCLVFALLVAIEIFRTTKQTEVYDGIRG